MIACIRIYGRGLNKGTQENPIGKGTNMFLNQKPIIAPKTLLPLAGSLKKNYCPHQKNSGVKNSGIPMNAKPLQKNPIASKTLLFTLGGRKKHLPQKPGGPLACHFLERGHGRALGATLANRWRRSVESSAA